jgi:hypothetical protein
LAANPFKPKEYPIPQDVIQRLGGALRSFLLEDNAPMSSDGLGEVGQNVAETFNRM